ncbi:MAG: hypothetical protein IJN39_01530, partial [Clostridia bacterium]|nr:hypothetical protein [Clostridia bacterium]
RVNSVIYTPSGSTTKIIENKTTTVTVPPKPTVAVAFNATVENPGYAKMYGTNLTDQTGKFVAASVAGTNDVLGHVVQISPDSYNAYVYSTHRPTTVDAENGISRMIIRYSIGGETWKAETDLTFPFEFSIPVSDSKKSFQYKVELYDKDSQKIGSTDTLTLAASYYQEETPVSFMTNATRGTTVKTDSNPTISGWGTANNTQITTTGNCFAFFKLGNDSGRDVDVTAIFALEDSSGKFKRIAKIVNKTVSASNTSSNLVNFSTDASDPIVLTDADIGNHLVVYMWSGFDTMKPYLNGKYNFATGKVE